MTFYGPKINYGWDFTNCSGSYSIGTNTVTMNLAWVAVPGAQSYKIFTGVVSNSAIPIDQDPTATVSGIGSYSGTLLSAFSGAIVTLTTSGITYTYPTPGGANSSKARVYLYLYAYSDAGATTRLTPFPAYCLNFFNGLSDGYVSAGPAKLTLDYTEYNNGGGNYGLINNDSLNVVGSPNKHIYTKSITVVA